MDNRERVNAIMHYESYDRMPVVAFGYWRQTLEKWCSEGHISREEAEGYSDNNDYDNAIMARLGFDFNWSGGIKGNSYLLPAFENRIVRMEDDGSQIVCNEEGLIIRVKPGVVSIPAHIGTSLTGREAWEELYLPKLRYCDDRVHISDMRKKAEKRKAAGLPCYLNVGSLYGRMRNLLGVENLAYLAVDDEDLYVEIIDTMADLCYQVAKKALTSGIAFDYAHFWEDICFKNGPLIRPSLFRDLIGPWYKKITNLLRENGVDIVSVDCDGVIDQLLPIWLENGVNTMFPIEVGTWHASFDVWRKAYGRELRGVGGMDKRIFAQDKAAVDREIERLKPLIDLGGYIPCPDHRIPPDAIWETVQYYCERFRKAFG